MSKFRSALLLALAATPVVAAGVIGWGAATAADKKDQAAKEKPAAAGIDPAADKLLRQMTDYLASLKSFKVRSSSVDQIVTDNGQKLQFVSSSDVSIERPNRMRAEQVGAENGLAFWYDGKTMTLACKTNNTYATAPAPGNLDATIDKARKDFQVDAPGADLLYSKPYEILTEQVKSGSFIGRETIDGQAANHLAFVGDEVDWQVWIKDGTEPLPLRFVITSKTVKGSPEFVVQMSKWEPNAKPGAVTYEFQAPTGAKKVQAIQTACTAGEKG